MVLLNIKEWRKKVYESGKYTCQKCCQVGGNLEAHHNHKKFSVLLDEFLKEYEQFSPIDDKETLIRLAIKWEPFWRVDDGITLCKDCHIKKHPRMRSSNGTFKPL